MAGVFLAAASAGVGQPVILTPPHNQTNVVGTTATFNLTATGTAPLVYQWQRDTGSLDFSDLAGATNSSLSLTDVVTADAVDYRVIVTGVQGSVTSTVATLTVVVPPYPVITTQPQNQTDLAGTTAIFTVVAAATLPLAYQWQRDTGSLDFSDLVGTTNATLVLTDVGTSDAVDYRVIITNVQGAVTSAVANLTVIVPPQIASLTNVYPSPSLGGRQALRVVASGSPLNFQWFLNGTVLIGQTGSQVNFPQVQATDLGLYTVVVTNVGGSVTSNPVRLDVDPSFAKITTGEIVTDQGNFQAVAWGDYDNDGYDDLFVVNSGFSILYHNNQDGTFTRITNGTMAHVSGTSAAAAWGDYDNDGRLDLFVANFFDQGNYLYHNDGGGTFTKAASGRIVSDRASSSACSWGDYDNDGFIDLFVSNLDQNSFLYHAVGDGTNFARVTPGILTAGSPVGCPWADFNNDGLLDLFVAASPRNLLYQNDGNGMFSRITNSSIATDPMLGGDGAAWGDYDNDGNLDLFVTDSNDGGNRLFHNRGDGTFSEITNSVLRIDRKSSTTCAWGDYDNDGYLDLFVGNGLTSGENNFLFHNNGDGTFTKILTGSLVNDGGASLGCAWADYDNDGFLDLFVANQNNGRNFLYRNNGNSNAWVKFKLVGTASNRSAIGAKVRIQATIAGKMMWQLRQISTGDGFAGNSLIAHFGLGDATNVDTVRIEWPSGIRQELHDVAARQNLTVIEPARLSMPRPGELHIQCWKGMAYWIEDSPDLVSWTPLALVTNLNLTGGIQWTDPGAPGQSARFYRAVNTATFGNDDVILGDAVLVDTSKDLCQ